MESVWSVSKLSTESVGSRRQLVANCVHTADADATKQFRRVGVGGVYWPYETDSSPAANQGCSLKKKRGRLLRETQWPMAKSSLNFLHVLRFVLKL